ncbi:MAG: serine/threonine protein kinase [Candidatus Riflebacteria bacterium]|nr:serine/threonine protein kinase [Candidatus Riflebacteria bacterium]
MGRYTIVSELGRGACGVVFRARDSALDREVAIRVLWPHLTGDREVVGRLHREVEVLCRLSHPNVVKILGSGTIGERQFVALELVNGADLGRRTGQAGRPQMEEVLSWLTQASEALAYLHENRIAHRGIRPGNLMVDPMGHLTVMDPGLALDAGLLVSTEPDSTVGAARYLPPEASRNEPPFLPQDVWALAITAHELLTGSAWCEPLATEAMVRRVRTDPPPTLEGLLAEAPAWLIELQRRALEKDPEKRLLAADYRDSLAEGLTMVSTQRLPVRPRRPPRP